MRTSYPVIKVIGASILCITASSPAYAYLDPGTGSLIIQIVIGAIAAIGVTLKLYWHKFRVFFSGCTKVTENKEMYCEESADQERM